MSEDEYEKFIAERNAGKRAAADAERIHRNHKGGLFAPGGPKPLEERTTTDDGKSEHWHQARLISWSRESAALQTDETKRKALKWLHSVPNGAMFGGKNPHAVANKLRAEGLTPGILDLRLDYVVRTSRSIKRPGLLIEMKKVGNDMDDEQREYMAFMVAQGFECRVCYTWQKAAREIVEYMGLGVYGTIY